MSLLLIGVIFIAGATFGALAAFFLAARSYDRGYSDALASGKVIDSAPPVSSGRVWTSVGTDR